MFNHISPQALEVLKALSRFHFLTNKHLVELGVSKSAHSLNVKAIRELVPKRDDNGNVRTGNGRMRAKSLCNNLRFGGVNDDNGKKQVKTAYLHYLTERGRNYLSWACEDEIDLDTEIWIPKPNDMISKDYSHRCSYIYAHIYLRRWAQQFGATVDFFNHYYQADPDRPIRRGIPPSINQIELNARTKSFTPDGLCGITYKGKSRLFVIEMHRRSDTKRVIDQLYRNMRIGAVVRAKFPEYETSNDPFILSIYTKSEIMRAAQKRIATNPTFAAVLKGIVFADLKSLKTQYSTSWQYADGSLSDLFA